MALDVAMGGSTNTVLHILAAAQEGEVDFDLAAIDAVSRRVPCLAKVAPNSDYHMEDVHRAGGIPAILGELRRAGLLHTGRRTRCTRRRSRSGSTRGTSARRRRRRRRWSCSTPRRAGCAPREAFSTSQPLVVARHRRRGRLHPRRRARVHARGRAGRAARQHRPRRRDHQDRRASTRSCSRFEGPARVVESQEEAVSVILAKQVQPGDVVVVRYEGPSGGPGMQEMLHPTAFLKGARARQGVRADHRRAVLRRLQRHLGGPHLARGRGGRRDRADRGRRPRRDRRARRARSQLARRRRGAGRAPREGGGDASGRGSRATATAR